MGDEKKLGFIITARDLASKEFKSVNGEIAKMEKTTKGAKTGLGGLASTVSPMKLALGGIGIASIAAAEGLSIAIDAASDLRESVSLSDSVFTENSKEVQAWAATAAGAFGQSKREALDFASNFGNAFKNVGLSLDESTDKAQEMTRLAADLGSAFNAGADEAALALRSGLLGESEPLRRFGVFLSEAATQAKAVELGIAKAGQKLTDAQKVTARYAIIMEDTAAIQGMFGKDTSSLADAQKELGAEVENLAADVGTGLVPVLSDLVQTTSDAVRGAGELGDALNELLEPVGGLGEVWDGVLAGLTFGSSKLYENAKAASDNAEAQDAAATKTAQAWGHASDSFSSDTDEMNQAYRDVAAESGQTERDVRADAKAMADHISDWKDSVLADGQAVLDNYYDPIETRSDLAATNAEINAQRMIIASTTATDAQIADAQRALTGLERDQGSYLLELAAAGKSGSATFQAGYNDILTRMKTAQGSELAMLKALKRELDLLIGKVYQAQAALINLRTSAPGYYNSEKTGYASGGYVPSFGTYDVGEAGREKITMFPGGGAFVTPHSSSGGSSGGSSSPMRASAPAPGRTLVVNFNSVWPPTREQAREIAELVDREQYSSGQRAVPTVTRT